MKTLFTQTKTAVAVSALLAAVAVSPANAVNIASNGLGDAATTAFYTVRTGYVTNISLVNTSDKYVVAVRLRFHEYMNSRDARDFNIFLSPNDVWTGSVVLPAGSTTPYIETSDTSCTVPTYMAKGTPNNATTRAQGFVIVGQTSGSVPTSVKRMDFINADYISNRNDNGGSSIGRTQEGYIEVIEMGVAIPAPAPNGSVLASYAVHSTYGFPNNCTALANVAASTAAVPVTGSGIGCEGSWDYSLSPPQWTAGPVTGPNTSITGNAAFHAEFCEPLNVLKVASNLVRVNTGLALQVPVTTFANFFNSDPSSGSPSTPVLLSEDLASPNPNDLMANPGLAPNLASVWPPVSIQIAPDAAAGSVSIPNLNGTAVTAGFTYPVDAVSSLLSASNVINEYRAGTAAAPFTAWTVTFPTKAFYFDAGPYSTFNLRDSKDVPWWISQPTTVPAPFSNMFNGTSCDDVEMVYWTTEERQNIAYLSPSPVKNPGDALCYEAQTINFTANSNLFGSQTNLSFQPVSALTQAGFSWGWSRLNLPDASGNTIVGADPIFLTPYTFFGLPATGFSFTIIPNGVIGASAVNTGYTTSHAYERTITAPVQ